MGARYLADTNAIIDLVVGRLPATSAEWLDRKIAERQIAISVITRIELLTKAEPVDEYEHMQRFIEVVEVLPLDEPVIWRTILLRQQRIVKDVSDCIIAATALEHDFALLTRNTKHFQKIDEAVVLNLHENFQQDLVAHGLVDIDMG